MDRRAPEGALADRRAEGARHARPRDPGRPGGLLGSEVCDRFGNELPFLFKVLAAAAAALDPGAPEPGAGARAAGRARTPRASRSTRARRNYRDLNHKPELLCALTPFVALKGFRPPDETTRALEPIARPELAAETGRLAREQTPAALRALFARLMTLEPGGARAAAEARGRTGRAPRRATPPGAG